jgi:hypothetical protein
MICAVRIRSITPLFMRIYILFNIIFIIVMITTIMFYFIEHEKWLAEVKVKFESCVYI